MLPACNQWLPVLTMLHSLSGRWTDTRTNIGQKLQSSSKLRSLRLCFAFLKTFYYPEHAEFAIGKGDSPKVVVLEVHCHNPQHLERTSGNLAIALGLFQKYHNTLCCSSKVLHKHCFWPNT